eukprot:13860834-Alexandrium_andersonii.AAC.1
MASQQEQDPDPAEMPEPLRLTDTVGQLLDVNGYLMPDALDSDILAEWDRKLMQPDYIPRVRGHRLEDMQG